MLRNREYLIFLLIVFLALGAAFGLGLLVSPEAALFSVGTGLVITLIATCFTRWRYRQLEKLSYRLSRINRGDYSLALRDEAEGELSILKSEIYKTTVMLREKNEQLQWEKGALQSLLTDISHQLKTPLTSMFVMIDLLSEEDLPEKKRREFTDRIRAQLERLQWLVTSLLKLSRLDSGGVQFKSESVPTQSLIKKALEPLLIPVELKQQTLMEDYDGSSLSCDATWTSEAILNILKNCVEHTPEKGSIAVTCHANPLYVEIRIEDSGPGINPKDLPHIWSRFYRGQNAQSDSVGIGLAMAAAIVQGQGGTVDAGKGKLGGSLFILRFPRKTPV